MRIKNTLTVLGIALTGAFALGSSAPAAPSSGHRTRSSSFRVLAGVALLALCGTAMAVPLSLVTAPSDPADQEGGAFDAADLTVAIDWQTVFEAVGPVDTEVNAYNNCSDPLTCELDYGTYLADFEIYQDALVHLNGAEALDAYEDNASGPGSPAVPEPATLALFGLGLAGIALSRRRLAR